MTQEQRSEAIRKTIEKYEKEAKKIVEVFTDGYLTYFELAKLLNDLHKKELQELKAIKK